MAPTVGTNRGVVLGARVTEPCGRTREIGTEDARFYDGHLDSERSDLPGQHLGKSFDSPLGCSVGAPVLPTGGQ
jgi:hypothetical protein